MSAPLPPDAEGEHVVRGVFLDLMGRTSQTSASKVSPEVDHVGQMGCTGEYQCTLPTSWVWASTMYSLMLSVFY